MCVHMLEGKLLNTPRNKKLPQSCALSQEKIANPVSQRPCPVHVVEAKAIVIRRGNIPQHVVYT
jgi:hypothetical protein